LWPRDARTMTIWEHRDELLHRGCAGHLPGAQTINADHLRDPPRAPRRPVTSTSPKESPR
jgi:3-mercaptopyruvate sulfurtransferase SseA